MTPEEAKEYFGDFEIDGVSAHRLAQTYKNVSLFVSRDERGFEYLIDQADTELSNMNIGTARGILSRMVRKVRELATNIDQTKR